MAVEAYPSDPDGNPGPPVIPSDLSIGMLRPNDYFPGPPNPPLLPYRTTNGLATGGVLDAASYPVYVDLFGFYQYPPPNWQRWIAGQPPGAANPAGSVPRCIINALTYPGNHALQLSLFSSPDDLNLGDLGVPQTSPGAAGQPQRTQQYSWAYLIRRSNATVADIVEMSIVIYRGRSLQFTADLLPTGETMFIADFGLVTPNVATLYWPAGGDPPNIKPGQWILDATMKDASPGVLPTSTAFIPHGYFYRVVSVTPGSAPNSMDVELQTPVRLSTPGPAGSGYGRAVIMDNVVEVFEKASLVP